MFYVFVTAHGAKKKQGVNMTSEKQGKHISQANGEKQLTVTDAVGSSPATSKSKVPDDEERLTVIIQLSTEQDEPQPSSDNQPKDYSEEETTV